MSTNLQISILEAAHDGLLASSDAITLMNYTYEGVNLDARREYKERTKAARNLVKQFRDAKKAGKFNEADKCLDKAIKILSDLQDSLKDYQDIGGFGSFVFSLFVPTLCDFVPLYGLSTVYMNAFNTWVKAFKKAFSNKGASIGDLNQYISRLNAYTEEFKKSLQRQKAELKKYRDTIAKESAYDLPEVTPDDILSEMADLV